MKGFLITIIGLIVIFGVGIYYLTRGEANMDENQVFCTLDAMMCPDGSYVGRVPPTCEFAACPATSTTTGNMMEDGTTSATGSIELDI